VRYREVLGLDLGPIEHVPRWGRHSFASHLLEDGYDSPGCAWQQLQMTSTRAIGVRLALSTYQADPLRLVPWPIHG